MAAMSALQEQIKEMTQCKICFEDKEHQKQLPCQHTICEACLTQMKQPKDSKYKCPQCNQEFSVPNGGLGALPESLMTKQLASLIQMRQWNPNVEVAEDTDNQGEAIRKLRMGIKKGNETLDTARDRIKGYEGMKAALVRNAEDMEEKLNKMMEDSIEKLRERVAKKVTAIREITEGKLEEVTKIMVKLEEACENATVSINQLNEQAKEVEAAKSNDSDQSGSESGVTSESEAAVDANIKQAFETVEKLRDATTTTSAEGSKGNFKAGDSVRLKMDVDLLKESFLIKDMNHSSVGYIHEVDGDGDCAVIFPGSSAWVGKTETLDKSSIKHDLPVIGDRVRVRLDIKEPHFKWGKSKHGSVGTLKELKNRGPREGREVSVDFPDDSDWKGIFDELEKVAPEPLKVGDEVWISSDVSEPVRGWAGVTATSVGTLLSVNGDDAVVNFPECKEWNGLLSELEIVRPISIGDKVRVLKTVSEPKTGWAGVTHKDEGIVKHVQDHSEYGRVAAIDFPSRLGLWHCPVSELEMVNRNTNPAASSGGRQGIQINARDAMQAMHSVSEKVMSDLSKQQCHQQ